MSYTNIEVQQVWNKGTKVFGYNSGKWRKDKCNAWINRDAYGNRDSSFGWEIDHIIPNATDALYNLQPLHWKNNLAKSDGRLVCVIRGVGDYNKPVY